MSQAALPITVAETGVFGVGYEGRDQTELVACLRSAAAEVVIDVRLNPISRKPGLSKTRLAAALSEVGIDYRHHRALGNPKDNRPGFAATGPEFDSAAATYRAILRTPAASDALDQIADLAAHRRVALLCFESAEHHCHRHLILEALAARSAAAAP